MNENCSGSLSEMSKEDYKKREEFFKRVRETKWDDADVETKLDKLRFELQGQRHHGRSISNLGRRIDILEKHEHGQQGQVLVPNYGRGYLDAEQGIGGSFDLLA